MEKRVIDPGRGDVVTPATTPCERCQGSGRTPRAQRRRIDGSPDPFDILGQHGNEWGSRFNAGVKPLHPIQQDAFAGNDQRHAVQNPFAALHGL